MLNLYQAQGCPRDTKEHIGVRDGERRFTAVR